MQTKAIRQPPTCWVAKGVLTGWLAPLVPWFAVAKPVLLLNSDYRAFVLYLLIRWELLWWHYGSGGVQHFLPARELVQRPLLCSRLHGHVLGGFLHGGAGWCWLGALGSDLLGGFLLKGYALELILVGEGEVALHLFPKLYHTPCQKAWLTSSRCINLLHPELMGLGICQHLFMLNFQDIPAGKDGIWWQQEVLLAKTQQCRQGLMVVPHLA